VDRVVLARHGESVRSVEGLTNGDPRVPCALTATGRDEARRLGIELTDDPIDLCVTSEFERVQETADLALAGRDVPRLVLAEMNDIRFGEFEGRPLIEYRAWAHARRTSCPAATPAQTVARYVHAYARSSARRRRCSWSPTAYRCATYSTRSRAAIPPRPSRRFPTPSPSAWRPSSSRPP
jgi:broad specificity phosphatase PhoE